MGRPYKSSNYFSPWDSNTICDRTGAKVKMSQVQREWNGVYVIPEVFNTRQPQDFPVTPQKQVTYPNARSEQVEAEGTVAGFDTI